MNTAFSTESFTLNLNTYQESTAHSVLCSFQLKLDSYQQQTLHLCPFYLKLHTYQELHNNVTFSFFYIQLKSWSGLFCWVLRGHVLACYCFSGRYNPWKVNAIFRPTGALARATSWKVFASSMSKKHGISSFMLITAESITPENIQRFKVFQALKRPLDVLFLIISFADKKKVTVDVVIW